MTTLRVETENSVYEIDAPNMRVRQLAGLRTTPRFAPQGEWHVCESLLLHPDNLVVCWPEVPHLKRYTITSRVLGIGELS